MKLRRLHVHRAPGLPRGLAPFEPGDGVTLLVGPNGAGKTTLCRAIRGTLWPADAAPGVETESIWTAEEKTWHVSAVAGRSAWHDEDGRNGAPALPDAHLARCWTLELLDLLGNESDTDGRIAHEVGVLLHGGYDLRAVREAHFSVRPRHGSTEARRLDDARRAVRTVRDAHAALAEREAGLAALERRRVDAEDAARLVPRLVQAVELARARAGLDSARRALDAFPDAAERITGNESELLEEFERDARERDAALHDADRALDAARRAADAAAAALGPDDPGEEVIAAWRSRARVLAVKERDRDAARLEADAAGRRAVERLAELGFAPATGVEGIEPLTPAERDAIAQLVREEADLAHRGGALKQRAETVRFRKPDRPYAWLALLACAVVVAATVAWDVSVEPLPRSTFFVIGLAAFVLLGFGVVAWHQPRRRRALDLAALEQRRARLVDEQREFDARRVRLAERLGLVTGTSPVGLMEAGEALTRARDERASAAQAEERAVRLGREIDETLARAGRELPPAGSSQTPADAAALEARLDALERSRSALREARERAERAEETRRAAERERDRDAERRRAFFERFDVADGDADALRTLIARHGEWIALRDQRAGLARSVADLEAKLAGQERLLDPSLDVATTAAELDRARERAATLAGIVEEIATIRADVESARSRDDMSNARAEERAVREALDARRDEALRALAGQVLLDAIETEYAQASRPAVLERADRLFGRFTGGRYGLRVANGEDGASFVAVDRDRGGSVAPAELSDGTRVQMQLAARVAFAEHVERGTPLPLLLDEVIATADDARFDAVAAALLALVEEGRQVVYLTSNRADLARWRQAAARAGVDVDSLGVVTLDADGAAEPAEPAALELPATPSVPPPRDGEDAPAYAARLGVRRLDPWSPPESAHVFWAVPDDARLLHALVRAGLRTIGRIAVPPGHRLPGSALDEPALTRVRAGALVVRETIVARRVGRGRAMRTADLADCPAVTAGWLDRLGALLDEVRGDGEAFFAAFEPPKHALVSGFRTAKLSELRAWARRRGHVDPRDPLEPEAIVQRVASALDREAMRGGLDLGEIERRVAWLLRVLGDDPDEPGGGDSPDEPGTAPASPGAPGRPPGVAGGLPGSA